jgi:dihydrofolate synthase / folylpolyglutamate synthase
MWCSALLDVDIQRADQALTYFEFITLAALVIIQKQAVDYAILEVGLGGRLDAVNIVEPDISVLTSIDLDHCDRLGSTRAEIAYEKMGIARPLKPLVCGDPNPPDVIQEKAQALPCVLWKRGRDFDYHVLDDHHWCFRGPREEWSFLPMPRLSLENAVIALMVCQCLPAKSLTIEAINRGLSQVFLPGRCQVIPGKIPQIWDVSHNPAGAAFLARFIANRGLGQSCIAVWGMLATKDWWSTVLPMLPYVHTWFIAPLQGVSTAKVSDLEQVLVKAGISQIHMCLSVASAYQQAQAMARSQDTIVVFGSFHTVAEVSAACEGLKNST